MGLIEYKALTDGVTPVTAGILEHTIAGNGLFIRAKRDVCTVTIQRARLEFPGLAGLTPGVELHVPKAPFCDFSRMLRSARRACIESGRPVEYLCYLTWNGEMWRYLEPEQEATAGSVRPVGRGLDDHARAVIEIHSHHQMPARFSSTDDADESTGFRIYGVVGRIFDRPEISMRVGCHGHFLSVTPGDFFEIPSGGLEAIW